MKHRLFLPALRTLPLRTLPLVGLLLAAAPHRDAAAVGTVRQPIRVFQKRGYAIDSILARPYDAEVPFGASGDRVWATSPQGWGFASGVQLLYVTNLNLFDLEIRSGDTEYRVGRAQYLPSHIHMVGAPGVSLTAAASFTYQTDDVRNPLSKPFVPEKRWTCWSSGSRTDTYTVSWGRPRTLSGLDLYFFDDQPTGGCAPPESVRVELYRNGAWSPAAVLPFIPRPGENRLRFAGAAERGEQARLTFHHRGVDRYTGLYGVEPRWTDPAPESRPGLRVTGDKWITADDVLVTRVTAVNISRRTLPLTVRMLSPLSRTAGAYRGVQSVAGSRFFLAGRGAEGVSRATEFERVLQPGESRTFTFAVAADPRSGESSGRAERVLRARDPLAEQVSAYNGWYDRNLAYFDCSDPRVRKMYYHRGYNLRKNSMDPRMGRLQHRAFAEGRWTSDWYANVISYGSAHQVRESRWLRDPSYSWGQLQTWTDNPRPDGIFPSHVPLSGPLEGQYADWITASAWDAYLVHPERATLAGMADVLARNAEGWRKVYGWGGSPELVVDSHWWTGMEWQPSFFSSGGYHTDRASEVPLRRVDLTAYNFGNARAAARIYRELGRSADAARLQRLADATRAGVLRDMWRPETRWFHSLRAADFKPSPDREIVGLYPFYFDLPPKGEGYEAAWKTALDPSQFWTTWPLASVARSCPAYSQTGWPIGHGGSICMWNGPSWPHANSIVLTAMANTLRHYGPSAVTREKLWELFDSFTRAQYRNGDLRNPWTGEYYSGDTGQWKTAQRDYNHSTYLDPLIHDLLGLVARPDDVLEIDPLLPGGTWDRYLLDGQAYRGHDVTLVYDGKGGHYRPGFRGYAVYLDGKQLYHGARPAHLLYDMKSGRLLSERHAAPGADRALERAAGQRRDGHRRDPNAAPQRRSTNAITHQRRRPA